MELITHGGVYLARLDPAKHSEIGKISYALVEHCRAITSQRLTQPRIAQLTARELALITHRLQSLIGL